MPSADYGKWFRATIAEAAWAPSLVFVAHVFAYVVLKAYATIPWLDMPFHFLGGFVIAYFFHRASINGSRFGVLGPYHPRSHGALVLAMVGTATVAWEFAEWVYDRVYGTRHQVDLDDTMLDMFLGLVGGSAFLIVAAARNGGSLRSPRDAAGPG